MDIQNGVYPAKAVQFTPYETANEALCIAILFEFSDQAPAPYIGSRLKYTATLVTTDKVVREKEIARLKDIFGWPGNDPFWFEDNLEAVKQIPTDITIENEDYTNPTTGKSSISPKIKWVNKQGEGGSGASMPTPSERSIIASKYGAKLRAVAGVGAAKTAPVAKPAAPVTKPAPPASLPGIPVPPPAAPKLPQVNEPKSSMEECWAALCKENEGMSETDLQGKWFALMAEKFPNVNQTDIKPTQWGKLLLHIQDNVPY